MLGREDAGVDADHSTLERFGDAEDTSYVPSVEIARETKRRVIGQPNALLFGREPKYRREGPERLFGSTQHVRCCISNDGRLDELPVELATSGHQSAAFGQGIGQVPLDLGYGGGLDERSLQDARLEAVAHLQTGHPERKLLQERVID